MAQVRSTTASGSTGSSVYESARAVEEYLQFHYAGEGYLPYKFGPQDALDFPKRCAEICVAHARPDRRRVAYDVGCSVGRSTFELSKTFDKVVGVDFSNAFIEAATTIKEKGELGYKSTHIAEIRTDKVATLPEGSRCDRIEFKQGDACNLGDIGEVDCLMAGNLLCRLPDPDAFLQKAADSITEGGILVLISPYSWLEEYTQKERWIGGKYDSEGTPLESHDEVTKRLSDAFELVARTDEPFLLREHFRKFQWGVSDVTVWRRRPRA